MIETFQCVPLSCRLTVGSCRMRRIAASRVGKPTAPALLSSACISCEVGAAHERGETPERWSDGSPVVRLGIDASAVHRDAKPENVIAPAPAQQPDEEPEEDEMGKQLTHNGITDSIAGWAKRLDITDNALRIRLKKMSAAEALSTKKLSPSEAGLRSAAKMAPAPRTARAAAPRAPRPAPIERLAPDTTASALELLHACGWTDAKELARTPAGLVVLIPNPS